MDKLKQSCRQVLERLQQRDMQQWVCILCTQSLRGQDALLSHLITTHRVYCEHFDNIADLEGLLDFLLAATQAESSGGRVMSYKTLLEKGQHQSSCSPSSPTHWQEMPVTAGNWRCPVCHTASTPCASTTLERHMQECGHHLWTAETIPELRRFYVFDAATSPGSAYTRKDTAEDVESKSGSTIRHDSNTITAMDAGTNLVEGVRADDTSGTDDDTDDAMESDLDDLSGWEEACPCLYCSHSSNACLQHMCDAHHFDLIATLRQRVGHDVHDDYDLIRLINAVRRSVDGHACPHCARSFHDGDDAGTSKHAHNDNNENSNKVHRYGFSGLEAHMKQNPAHRLPLHVSRDDGNLIPVLRGDPLISFLLANSDTLFGLDNAEPNYPAVPTVLELAAARRAAMQK